ncbi:MAG: hypothetical protein Q4B22_03130 [Eubacteriales bacterium]|nr:hypothetical protein [Eubacteriales bacterium]
MRRRIYRFLAGVLAASMIFGTGSAVEAAADESAEEFLIGSSEEYESAEESVVRSSEEYEPAEEPVIRSAEAYMSEENEDSGHNDLGDRKSEKSLAGEIDADLYESDMQDEENEEMLGALQDIFRENAESQNYDGHAWPIGSAIVATDDGGIMLFENNNSKYLIEYYDSKYTYRKKILVDRELPVYGGFYSDGSNYYILSGQNNPKEDDSVEVFRITKYSKSWKRLGHVSVSGVNTYEPMKAGSARFAHNGDDLIIRTCHTMYRMEDGLHHQSSFQMRVNTRSMKLIEDSENAFGAYTSHSFNQFVKIDNGHIVTLDHGDAYPRAVVVTRWSLNPEVEMYMRKEVYEISGRTGDNDTGVSVGGFEIADTTYLAAGNTVVMGAGYRENSQRNIFTVSLDRDLNAAYDKWDNTEPALHMITSYGENDGKPSTPHLVKVNGNTFLLLWSINSKLCYCMINGKGERTSAIYQKEGELSDCAPIIKDGKCVWYVTERSPVKFYEIPVNDLNSIKSYQPVDAMYRMYNENSGEHFYTRSIAEADYLWSVGWIYEGIGWFAPAQSRTPVYRLYNPNVGDHHYTTSAGERNFLVKQGWNYEGIGWYSNDRKEVPLYRQYNPNAVTGSHNYTSSKAENNYLVSIGWNGEGIGWYGMDYYTGTRE